MTVPTSRLNQPRIIAPGDGEHLWLLDNLVTVKLGAADTGGDMTVIELVAPPGFGPPLHRHDIEDELFVVLEGEITFWCAGIEASHGPGGIAWLPRGLPHRFRVGDEQPARMLQITSPAQFEDFARAVGEPAGAPVLPAPSTADVGHLVRIAAEFQIEILNQP